MSITITQVKDKSTDDKLYVQDKHGFIYDLLHDWGDVVTVVTENGKHILQILSAITLQCQLSNLSTNYNMH